MHIADARKRKQEAGENVSQEAIQRVQISLTGAVRRPTRAVPDQTSTLLGVCYLQGWARGSFVEAEAGAEAERSRQRRGKAAMSLTEARQGRGRELEAEARQTKFEARPRRGDP